jgi:hypothetical protein
MTRRSPRALLALALVLLTSGCLRFRADLAISSAATVTGTVVVAAKLTGDLPADVATPPGITSSGDAIRTEPYAQDGYLGTRVVLADATFAQVERFFADQGGSLVPALPGLGTGQSALVAQLRMRRDGPDVVVDGRFLFPDFAAQADPGDQFEARLAITFPGEVHDSTGSTSGRTVTWTFRQGRAQDVQARASLDGGSGDRLLWAATGVLALGLVVAVAGLFRYRATRQPAQEPTAHGVGAPVPPGPGLSRPPTYGGS